MIENITFAEANKRLEEAVTEMQDKNVDIDDFIKRYEEVCGLLAFCYKSLDGYRERVDKAREEYTIIEKGGMTDE